MGTRRRRPGRISRSMSLSHLLEGSIRQSCASMPKVRLQPCRTKASTPTICGVVTRRLRSRGYQPQSGAKPFAADWAQLFAAPRRGSTSVPARKLVEIASRHWTRRDRCASVMRRRGAFSAQTRMPDCPLPESWVRLVANPNTPTAARRQLTPAPKAWKKRMPPALWARQQSQNVPCSPTWL